MFIVCSCSSGKNETLDFISDATNASFFDKDKISYYETKNEYSVVFKFSFDKKELESIISSNDFKLLSRDFFLKTKSHRFNFFNEESKPSFNSLLYLSEGSTNHYVWEYILNKETGEVFCLFIHEDYGGDGP